MDNSSSVALPLAPAVLQSPTRVGKWPILGALPGMLTDAPGTMLAAMREHVGELFALQLGPVQVPVVYRPADIQNVLLENAKAFTKGGMWSATRPLLGEGLVTSDGEAWRKQRQLMQPVFTPKHLATLGALMAEAVEEQLNDLDTRIQGPVDIGNEMTLITQNVLFRTMFGTSLDPKTASKLGLDLNRAFEAMNLRIFLYFLPDWVPLPGSRDFFGSIAAIDEALNGVVAERRAHPTERPDLLNLLLGARDPETGEGMDDKLIRDQLVTLFVAGLDTTAVTLTWLLYLLDEHPEVDAKLRAEVERVLEGRSPRVEDLPKLSYTKQVIQETMRLYPPAWIFPRFAENAEVVGDRHIAPGTSLLISPWLTHRDPQSWENPDTFDPDRFSAERSAGRSRFAYIPFGVGGRQCIGNHFAMMEAQIATALLVQRYTAKRAPGAPVVPASTSTLKPKGGLKMQLS